MTTVAVLGSLNRDTVCQVARFPLPGETIMATAMTRHAGGKGLNQAIAAARAGAGVSLAGAVGADADGTALMSMLEREGVEVEAVARHNDLPTGTAHILVDADGENQIVVAPGANRAAAAPPPAATRVLLAQLEVPLETVAAFLAARPAGSIAILNAAPFDPAAADLFALADIVIVNETELAAYRDAPAPPASPDKAAAMARPLLTSADQRVIVTLGALGAVTVGRGSAEHAPGVAAKVVDTTGAGDCFCGYLAAGLALGTSLDEAIALAGRAAAIAVGRPGAADAMPLMAELDRHRA